MDDATWTNALMEQTSDLMALTTRVVVGETDPAEEGQKLKDLVQTLNKLALNLPPDEK